MPVRALVRTFCAAMVCIIAAATLAACGQSGSEQTSATPTEQPGWMAGPNMNAPHDDGRAFVVESDAGTFLYVAGGTDLDGASATVERAKIDENGTLDGFEVMDSLPGRRRAGMVLVDQGWVFFFGGWDNIGSDQAAKTIFRAPIDSATGVVGPWEIIPSEESELAALTQNAGLFTYQGRVYLVGGSCASAGDGCPLGEEGQWDFVQSAELLGDGKVGPFTIQEDRLTQRLQPSLQTLLVGDTVYNFGGGCPCDAEGTAAIESAPIAGDGTVGPWAAVGELPEAARVGAALLVDGTVEVLGGYHGQPFTALDTVLQAPSSSPLDLVPSEPLPVATRSFAAATYGGRVYILGGSAEEANVGTLISAASD